MQLEEYIVTAGKKATSQFGDWNLDLIPYGTNDVWGMA
jgi:hypothetical protein